MNTLWQWFCIVLAYALVYWKHPWAAVSVALFLTPVRWDREVAL